MKIELRGVLKSYRSVRALDHVSLQIDPGQIVSLLGPNGAGKTTLIRCLAGIAAPDKGGIYFDDQEFQRDRLDLRSRIYLMPDFPFLFWEHSILRNIAIILRLYEADGEGAEKRVLELLRDFDLLPLALRPVYSLSRGQIYKTGLVAMLAADREIWLMDEPFASGMDPQGIDAFKRHAREAASRGRTILYSTQILDVAERFSERVSGRLPSAARRRRCAPAPFQPSLRLRSTVSARRPQTEAGSEFISFEAIRLNQTDATAIRRREHIVPSGFVNCAAHYTAPFRLARTLRNWLKPAVSFLLANAHVASCGWLGIHEAHHEAFGFSNVAGKQQRLF